MRVKLGNSANRPDLKTIKRFLSKAQTTNQPDACWIWTGSKSGQYGQIREGSLTRWAHRVSYAIFNGSLPEHHDVHHTCHNTLCVNPDHLTAETRGDNVAESNVSRRAGDTEALPF